MEILGFSLNVLGAAQVGLHQDPGQVLLSQLSLHFHDVSIPTNTLMTCLVVSLFQARLGPNLDDIDIVDVNLKVYVHSMRGWV